MNFLDIVKSRYSVRNYTTEKIGPEKREKISAAAHAAPTAGFPGTH